MTTWTRTDHTRLETLLEAGLSYAAAAKKLRRSVVALQVKASRRRLTRGRADAILHARDVERLLGIPNRMAATRWIRRGWLAATNTSAGHRPTWRITQEAMYAFLSDARYSFAWHPALIPDPELRAWATRIRATQPRWLTTTEAAARLGVSVRLVSRWCQSGALPATKYQSWHICETALDTFRAPGGHQ
jgi:excisionase family DNA binding protein